LIMPIVESLEVINTMEEAMSIDGIKAFGIGLTDVSRVLGHPFDVEHPDVWRVLDKAVNIAEKKGIWIGANVSYIFHDIESIVQRVKRLHDHGVDMVYMQGTGYLINWAGKAITAGIRAELGYS
jgi:2-keto-3-deoxy-L-rhamnonate aldolase RhmA